MQKIQSYLYPNRHLLLADLAGFTVENTVVYAKNIKIYQGVDNVIEFDVQNADQKRIDLVTTVDPDYTAPISSLRLNIMDASGKGLPSSPYIINTTDIKGIARVTIPSVDLEDISHQFLKYSVTALNADEENIPLYTDSRFSAVGTIEVVRNAMPVNSKTTVYDRFSGEINYMGNVTNHSSAFQCKFYEAIPTDTITITVDMTNFIGDIWVEGTEDSTISVSSFNNAPRIQTFSTAVAHTQTGYTFTISVGNYNNLRVSWQYPNIWAYGSQQDPTIIYGSVDKVTITR